jgi:hypothetical protein
VCFSCNSTGIITEDESVQMEWKHYWRKVVAHHKVAIEGWPDNIPFKNLSEASSALHKLKSLLEQWQDGRIHWKKLTDEEAERLFEEHRAQGKVPEATRHTQSDRGKKRKCPSKESATGYHDEEAISTRTRKRCGRITSAPTMNSGNEEPYDDEEEY